MPPRSISEEVRHYWKASMEGLSLPQGLVLGGRYVIEGLIGGGGMGQVYRVRHQSLGKVCAAKVLQRSEVRQDVTRFHQEALCLSGLQHPNLVAVSDYGELDCSELGMAEVQIPYFIMEFIEGEDLAARLRRVGRLAWPEARAYLLQICRGLGYLHRRGIVHRDIKPGNIMLVRDADGGELVKIVDFGLAKSLRESARVDLTQSGTIMGTALYISPEQIKGPAEQRSDMYSFGVLMYQALTGRTPFVGETADVVLIKHLHEAPVPLREIVADVPASLETIVLRTLRKDPSDRFADMAALEAALLAVENDAPAMSRRRATLLITSGVLLGVVLVVILVAWWSARPRGVPVAQAHVPKPIAVAPVEAPVRVIHEALVDTDPADTLGVDPTETGDEPPAVAQIPGNVSGETPVPPRRRMKKTASRGLAESQAAKDQPVDATPAAEQMTCASLSTEVVAAIFQAVSAPVASCRTKYDKFGRSITISATISSGKVQAASIVTPESAPEGLAECVQKALRTAEFPACTGAAKRSHLFSR